MKLKFLVQDINTGYTFREKVYDDPVGDLWVVQMRDVHSKPPYIRKDEMIRINSDSIRTANYLQSTDVLIISRGFRFRAIPIEEDLPHTIASSAFLVVRCDTTKLHPDYLAWYLNQPKYHQRLLARASTTSGLTVLRKQELEDFDIQLPSVEKQHKIGQIAKLLERETALYQTINHKREKLVNSYLQLSVNPS